ncbi:MAG: TolC family protein [Thermovirgaceae bacterium]|nr:TolC family protein [Thermovirgaceae bacterium]
MKITRISFTVFMFVLLSVRSPVLAADAGAAVFSLDKCIEIALSSHPDLAASKADLKSANARVGQARTAGGPSIGFSSGYSERSPEGSGSTAASWSSSVTLSQLVTDWGKTHAAVRKSLQDMESTSMTLERTVSEVVYEVKRSYFLLLKAEKNLEVAKETLALNDAQLNKAKAFFEVGRVSKYDVTSAQVSRSNGNLAMIQARTSFKDAMTSLRTAMGYFEPEEFSVADITEDDTPATGEDLPELEEAVRSALEKRPDLQAYVAKVESARASVTLSKLGNAPELSLSGSYGWGAAEFLGNDTWRAGMTLSFSIYDGGLQREKTRESLANLAGTEARLESLRQTVVSEVSSAWLAVRDSVEVLAAAEEGLKMASDNLEIASGRYRVGVGSPLEVADATKYYAEARAGWYGALYDRMIAKATLEKAMGGSGK